MEHVDVAFSCRFVYVCVTVEWSLGNTGLELAGLGKKQTT